MRFRLTIVAVTFMALTGCAATDSRDKNGTGHATPIVTKTPSISDRVKYGRQRDAEQAAMGLTEVHGAARR